MIETHHTLLGEVKVNENNNLCLIFLANSNFL